MKKILIVLSVIVVLCLAITPIYVGAETPQAEMTEEGIAGDNSALQGAEEGEGETESLTDFFNTKIVPFLVSSGTTLVGYLVMLLPMLKKSSQYKALQAYCTGVVENNKQLQEVISLIDIDAIKDKVQGAVDEALTKAVKELRLDGQLYTDFMSQIELMKAQLSALIAGATNAWASSPSAVSHLTEAPTQSVVQKQAHEIHALKEAIRTIKGEDAEAIIAEAIA